VRAGGGDLEGTLGGGLAHDVGEIELRFVDGGAGGDGRLGKRAASERGDQVGERRGARQSHRRDERRLGISHDY
jgi:hypothetical protein